MSVAAWGLVLNMVGVIALALGGAGLDYRRGVIQGVSAVFASHVWRMALTWLGWALLFVGFLLQFASTD